MAETLPLPPELARTLELCLGTVAADVAATIARNPRSTITPSKHTPDPEMAAAVDLLRELGPELASPRALEIEGTLGEGGMGVVRLATQRSVGRKVALKTLREGVDSRVAAAKLLHEGWTLGALEHPNVVPVYDVGSGADGTPFIVLKRIEGEHWGSLMNDAAEVERRFGVTDLREWNLRTLLQVMSAVHFAHARGVLHRDLKPENVMIGQFGEIYVVDWGIAVSLREDTGGRVPLASRAARLAGTPCYMAPEMIAEDVGPLSERTDVYLLGGLLHEILTGRPPHQGSELMAIFASVLLSEPALPDEAPKELVRICQRAMARVPSERFESAEAMRLALQDYLSHADSMRLARGAERSLERLLAQTSGPEPAERAQLYDLLGECRFGFRSALQGWPGNEDARRGLAEAVSTMARYELERGDPHAADLLLRELERPPAQLAARVEEARRARAEAERKAEELRRVGAELDPNVGRRTRVAVLAILGGIWTITPLLGHFVRDHGRNFTHAAALGFDTGIALVVLAVLWWARESMSRTTLNKRMALTIVAIIVVKTTVDLWAWLSGRHAREGLVFSTFLFFTLATVSAIHLSWKLLPTAAAYLLVFLISDRTPDYVFVGLAGANLTFTLSVLWMWLPARKLGRGFWSDEVGADEKR